jgi:hypothetical protein
MKLLEQGNTSINKPIWNIILKSAPQIKQLDIWTSAGLFIGDIPSTRNGVVDGLEVNNITRSGLIDIQKLSIS